MFKKNLRISKEFLGAKQRRVGEKPPREL